MDAVLETPTGQANNVGSGDTSITAEKEDAQELAGIGNSHRATGAVSQKVRASESRPGIGSLRVLKLFRILHCRLDAQKEKTGTSRRSQRDPR